MRFFDRRLVMTMALTVLLAACGGKSGAASTEDMSLGKADAKVTVIEYASASCSHCAQWNNEVFPAFKAKYIDTGRVHYVFREFLTPPVEMASAAFLMARCAGDDKYFPVIEAVFHNQSEMYQSGDIRGGLLRIAQSVGMSEKQFTQCISDDESLKALNDRVEGYARAEDISGTPTFVINGKKMDSGEMSLAQLDAAIAEAEAAAK
jgi:protein-disulfide isomerase